MLLFCSFKKPIIPILCIRIPFSLCHPCDHLPSIPYSLSPVGNPPPYEENNEGNNCSVFHTRRNPRLFATNTKRSRKIPGCLFLTDRPVISPLNCVLIKSSQMPPMTERFLWEVEIPMTLAQSRESSVLCGLFAINRWNTFSIPIQTHSITSHFHSI